VGPRSMAACLARDIGLLVNTESSPNVEYGKMRSELNECALGVDLMGIHSAFYFIRAKRGLPGEFYQFANSIRSELSAVSVRPLKETA
jgi:hypothetical protein